MLPPLILFDRSIVNGLREEDEDDFADRRASFDSDFSSLTHETNADSEAVQVFLKEHKRNASKGSNQSFATRKSKKPTNGVNRPETKVTILLSKAMATLLITSDAARSSIAHPRRLLV